MTTQTAPTTRTVAVDGATLTYDVRPSDGDAPALMLIGSPMGAGGFATLASHFPDRTIVTYDPRGVERSVKDDAATESTPDQHASDQLVSSEARGSSAMRGSSGMDLRASEISLRVDCRRRGFSRSSCRGAGAPGARREGELMR